MTPWRKVQKYLQEQAAQVQTPTPRLVLVTAQTAFVGERVVSDSEPEPVNPSLPEVGADTDPAIIVLASLGEPAVEVVVEQRVGPEPAPEEAVHTTTADELAATELQVVAPDAPSERVPHKPARAPNPPKTTPPPHRKYLHKDGAMSAEDIAEILGVEPKEVRSAIARSGLSFGSKDTVVRPRENGQIARHYRGVALVAIQGLFPEL